MSIVLRLKNPGLGNLRELILVQGTFQFKESPENQVWNQLWTLILLASWELCLYFQGG